MTTWQRCLAGIGIILWAAVALLLPAYAVQSAEPIQLTVQKQPATTYFQALSSIMERPVIASNKAQMLQISGQFDLSNPMQSLKNFSRDLGLIWYFDGQALYIYRQDELASTLVRLERLTVDDLVKALREGGIYDERYALNARPDASSFYLSAPPKYVQLVTKTASLLDSQYQLAQKEHTDATVAVIKVRYRPVLARTLTLRGEKQQAPGLIDILRSLWEDTGRLITEPLNKDGAAFLPPLMPDTKTASVLNGAALRLKDKNLPQRGLWILADSENNSIILRGDPTQIHDARILIHQLDRQRQQIQLSLKVIDVKESEVTKLGIDWSGGFKHGNLTGVINPSLEASTLVSTQAIMARIHALTQKSQARIISRPIVLTQDNVTAYFDNSHSFYIKLEAERVVDLKTITYGTLISATPRIIEISGQIPQVEMQLKIEDGSRDGNSRNANTNVDSPISQTRIETLARVPSAASLLIGGYTRSERVDDNDGVPGLSRLPLIGRLFRYQQPRRTNVVRLFLIEPTVLKEARNSEVRLEEWLMHVRDETSRSQL